MLSVLRWLFQLAPIGSNIDKEALATVSCQSRPVGSNSVPYRNRHTLPTDPQERWLVEAKGGDAKSAKLASSPAGSK